MGFKDFFTTKKILFILLFAFIAFIADQINFSAIVGANKQYFTFFQFLGPLTGAFLGPIIGAIAVLLSQVGNYLMLGKAFDVIGILRLAPMIFAAYYFGTKFKNKVSAIVPLVCMIAFWLHPIGQQAWFFALYWLIPPALKLFSDRLFFKALGATFTAHAIGSTLWLYTIPMPAEAWIALIPVVAIERFSFAIGITFSYIGINTLLSKVEVAAKNLNIDKRYVIGKQLLGMRA